MTAALVPRAALLRSLSVLTVTGAALPPPVVVSTPLPATAAHPTRSLGGGGVEEQGPPSLVTGEPPVPAEPPVPVVRPASIVPPVPVARPASGVPPAPPAPA